MFSSKRGGEVNCSLYSQSGQLVLSGQHMVSSGHVELRMNLAEMESGNYILVVSSGGTRSTVPVMKQ